MNRCTPDVNGRSEGSASTSSSSRRSRTPRNVLPDRESKSTNITKMVGIRINAIRVQSSKSCCLVVWHVGFKGDGCFHREGGRFLL